MKKKSCFAWIMLFGMMCVVLPRLVKAETCDHDYYSAYKYVNSDAKYHKSFEVCYYCSDERYVLEEHYFEATDEYKQKNGTEHSVVYKCYYCDAIKEVPEKHDYFEGIDYEYYDSTNHKVIDACIYCSAQKSSLEKHELENTWSFKSKDDVNHLTVYHCEKCDSDILIPEKHDYYATDDYEKKDSTNHYQIYKCDNCGHTKKVLEKHSFEETDTYKKVNDKYDAPVHQCKYCEEQKLGKKLKHNYALKRIIKLATPKKKGVAEYVCLDCKAKKKKNVKWKYDTEYSASYNIVSRSVVFRNSKTITLKLERALKGGVVKVKIGKKTFSKKIKNNKKKVSVKIKNPKYGSTIKVKVYYKGKLAGVDYSDSSNYVFYAKKIKRGMTKKQVENLYEWGSPDSTASSSGGWTFWYYDDGSWIDFKKGKVYSWYNTAG